MGGGGRKKPKFGVPAPDAPVAAQSPAQTQQQVEAQKPLLQEKSQTEQTMKARENQRRRAQNMFEYASGVKKDPLALQEEKKEELKTLLGS